MKCEIVDVDSENSFALLLSRLREVKRFSFDTEYDCFRRYYGFTLFLLSIYDGESVYLIDPKKIPDFSLLWDVMEDASVQKVLYAGSEDLALLHSMGCRFRNIFDVQISAYFANHEARGLSDLIALETGRKLNKNAQLSDWSKRPLSPEQREYAANDVNALLEIADRLRERVRGVGLEEAMEEEFRCLEEVVPRDFSPKLKPNYYREQSIEYCRVLLAAYLWRDSHARRLNVPPHYIVNNDLLEQYLFQSSAKYNSEYRGFHPRVISSDEALSELIEIRESFDASKTDMYPRNRVSHGPKWTRGEETARIDRLYNPVRDRINEKYGEITGSYLLRNVKRHLLNESIENGKLRRYQEEILAEMLRLA
jgi:ribonuclease D